MNQDDQLKYTLSKPIQTTESQMVAISPNTIKFHGCNNFLHPNQKNSELAIISLQKMFLQLPMVQIEF